LDSPLVVLTRASVAADVLATRIVAQWWGRAVEEVHFERSANGKPYVAGGPAFNVSHSGEWVAVAVAGSGDLGVDIECVRPVKQRVARRVFGTTDLTPDEFTRRWAIAEACVKADGRGIGLLLDEGGFASLGDSTNGTWRGYRWWSGRVEGAYWAVALSEETAVEPVVRLG
jgi:phosphopantetheinyl transferase